MKRTNLRFFNVVLVGVLVLTALLGSTTTPAKADDPITVFVNEIHYDNTGDDVNEAIEIAGPAGTDLTGWNVLLYNGSNGTVYGTIVLNGTIPDQQNGFGTLNFPHAGIQNGAPDGLALVKPDITVVQFLSYEGSFTANGGAADGMTSTDIGKTEGSSTPVGHSLQLTGSGTTYEDFTWADPMAATAGAVNTGQTFVTVTNEPVLPTCPAAINLETGETASEAFSAVDADGVVVSAEITSVDVPGISLTDVTPATAINEVLTGNLVVSDTTAQGNYSVELTFTNNDTPDAQTAVCTVPVTIAPPWTAPEIYINEVDADTPGTDTLEFVELYDGGVGNTSLDGLVVVFYNGSDDQSYESYDLDGYSTDANGYFLLGNSAVLPAPGIVFGDNGLQNGADAVALYEGDASSFPNDTPLTTTQLIDAIVYDTDDSDDAGLLPLLNAGQPQVDENGGGDKDNQSNQRCPNGSGGLRNTESFSQFAPTPGEENTCNSPIVPTCPAAISILQGESTTEAFSAVDQDGVVVSADMTVTPAESGITLSGVTPAAVVNEPLSGNLVVADTTPGGVYSVEISFANDDTPDAQTATCTVPVSVIVPAACLVDSHQIGEVQGAGAASPLAGTPVTISGVVTSVYQGTDELGGFFLQDPDGDGDPQTSDGIFVYSSTPVSEGYYVQVDGTPQEYYDNTQIASGSTVSVCTPAEGVPTTVMPTEISLPVTTQSDLEIYEGMLVTFPQELMISEYHDFDRYGELVLTTERFLTHTAENEPDPVGAAASEAEYQQNKIVWDDGRTTQNPDPAYHPNGLEFTLDNLFRGGDILENVTGTIYFGFGDYKVIPTIGADYTPANPRPVEHDAVGGSLKVASFNVLNYFTTLGSRGADTAEEFTRQRDKIIAAISAIDADVVGLIEIENNTAAVADLVNGLNDAMGADTYAYVDTGIIGSDAIKVAFIYKPAAVSLVGDYAILDSSVDPRFIDTKNRPVLAQTFEEIASGEKLTIAVNHLKSKGSDCDDLGDPDLDDGAGNCNLTRKAAAEAMVDWLAADPTGSGDPDFLIMGDLNAYDKEDPIDAILEGPDDTLDTDDDYTDLLYRFIGEDAYSYVFDGRIGYLDHALANASLNTQLTGAAVWHINADEADLINYDMTYKKDAQDAIYAPDPYRSSDHDPVIVGLSLGSYIPVTGDFILYFPIIFR